jgi:hypothetical protein
MGSHALLIAAMAATTLSAGRLAAQDPAEPAPPLERLDQPPLPGHEHLMRVVMNRRARLGITLNLQARETDSLGAYVQSVTPNGPAAKAGLRSGDIITKVDGKSVLDGGRAAQDADGRQSLPGLRVIELAARLEPSDTVPVEFLRGKNRRTVSVVTEEEPDVFVHSQPGMRTRIFSDRASLPLPAGDFLEGPDGPGDHFTFLTRSPLAALELAPLNPDLGQYFGTTEGVLVISVPKDASLGLKGGDVVLSVDGRKPASPSHLLRILRSYERGESFKLDVLRNRKRETVTARLPERER